MNKISRRALAQWAVSQLEAGHPASHIATQIAAVLKQNGTSDQVDFLISDIAWELEQHQTLAMGKITTAHQLSVQMQQALADKIKKVTGAKQVVLTPDIDKSVIGGVRVETPSRAWDATVQRKLSQLKEVF